MITRKWEEGAIYNKENYFQEDHGEIDESYLTKKKRLIRVPNKHNFYFKFKYSKAIQVTRLNKPLTLFEQFIKWTSTRYFDNEKAIFYCANELMKKEKFDFILTSGEPFILFKYATILKRKFNIKIALDYRDGWSTNSFKKASKNFVNEIVRRNEQRVEKTIIANADLLLFASQTLKEEVYNHFNLKNIEGAVINNGIKLTEKKNESSKFLKEKKFYITFIGTLYPEHNLLAFLNAIDVLIKDHNCTEIILVFVGSMINCPIRQKAVLENFKSNHEKSIVFIDYVNNDDAIKIQFESTVLLKFNSFEQKKGHFGKKLYEYAFSGKKVIAVDTKEGFQHQMEFFDDKPFIYNNFSSSQIIMNISAFYETWKNNGSLSNEISVKDLDPFSTQLQTNYLEKLLFHKFTK